MFSGSEATVVTPGDYYDYKNYDFIHETNDTEFLSEFPPIFAKCRNHIPYQTSARIIFT